MWMRAANRLDALPSWLRPGLVGPLVLCYAILLRGGIIIGPLVGYY